MIIPEVDSAVSYSLPILPAPDSFSFGAPTQRRWTGETCREHQLRKPTRLIAIRARWDRLALYLVATNDPSLDRRAEAFLAQMRPGKAVSVEGND